MNPSSTDGDDAFVVTAGSGAVVLDGGSGNDTLSVNYTSVSTAQNGVFYAGGTQSLVQTSDLSGDSVLFSNIENLNLMLGSGDDSFTVSGAQAAATIDAGPGNDRLIARYDDAVAPISFSLDGPGLHTISGTGTMVSNFDYAIVYGGAGNDTIVGGAEGDILRGGAGENVLMGGAGNDGFITTTGVDHVFGGDGTDYWSLTQTNAPSSSSLGISGTTGTYSLSDGGSLQSIEMIGALYSGVLTASFSADLDSISLTGARGSNIIVDDSPLDKDMLIQADVYSGISINLQENGSYLSRIAGYGFYAATVSGGSGDDGFSVRGSSFSATFDGGGGDNQFSGDYTDATADVIQAVLGAAPVHLENTSTTIQNFNRVTISTGSGNDFLGGSAGADGLYGGSGNDTYVVNNPNDMIQEGHDQGFDTIETTMDQYTIPENFEGLIYIGADNFRGLGNEGANILEGGVGNDTLTGGASSDTIDGAGGADTTSYASFAHDYAITLRGGAGTVAGGPEGGIDALSSIDNVQFLDGTLTFDPGSTAAEIVRLYDSFLGRGPDPYGFDSYLNFIGAGHSFEDAADLAAASPEFQQATAGLSDADYITYVYEHSLHRAPDAYGLQQYEAALANHTLTRTSLIVQAAESPEHVALTAGLVAAGLWIPDAQVESLELLYDAAVQRAPDGYGLQQYGALIANGASYRDIANQMAGSAEFLTAHAGQDDAAFVQSLYQAELGRGADPGGLAAYTDQLAHGYTRGDILYETAFSLEHQSHVLAFADPLLG